MRKEDYALLALNAVPGLTPDRLAALMQAQGSAVAVLEGVGRAALAPEGAALQGWTSRKLWELAQREEAQLRCCGAHFFSSRDRRFPACLGELEHPPPVLAYRGERARLEEDRPRIALVGARACTPYGRVQAARFGAGLASAGAIVVSGAARGIDQAAMEGALHAGGTVVAVIGSGIDCPYPPENRPLLDQIVAAGGLLLSEFACGTPPLRVHFPRRNRIMAAAAHAVVVIQATTKSGSMITASWAGNLGRPVMAVPGPVDSVVSHGPHSLLRDGAALVESPEDVLVELRKALPRGAEPWADPAGSPVALALAQGDQSADELAAALAQPVETVLLELVQMEMSGAAVRLPGGIYHRCRPPP